MVANILPLAPTPPDHGEGSNSQNSTFLEHGHFVYQIICNHECSNMVENILPTVYF